MVGVRAGLGIGVGVSYPTHRPAGVARVGGVQELDAACRVAELLIRVRARARARDSG